MKALSIRQPWAWLVVNGLKNIENRERRFSHRGPLLIHAAAWMTDADYEACRIFVDGICEDLAMPAPADLPRGGIVGEVVVLDCVAVHPSPWFTGPWGLVLDEACECDLIKWRGMPGLFEVPIADMRLGPVAESHSAQPATPDQDAASQACPKCGEPFDPQTDMVIECPGCSVEGSTACCNMGGRGCLCNACEAP